MKAEIQRLLDAIAELREKAHVNAVFGEPVDTEGRTLIPVAKVGCGFKANLANKAGVDKDTDETAEETGVVDVDGCGCAMAKPFAVIEVTPEGTWVEPIIDQQRLALAGALLTGWSVFWIARTLVKILGPRD